MPDGTKRRAGASSSGSGQPWKSPIEERLRRAELSKGRSRLVREILAHSDDNCFLTSRKLAERYNVDAATVVRTIQALGYRKYGDFMSDLRSHFILHMTPYTVMKAAAREKRSIADHVAHSLEMDSHNLAALRSNVRVEQIVTLARQVERSNQIVIVGVDLAATLSYLLSYLLVSIGFNADPPVGSTGNVVQKVNLLGPGALLIAVSFGRCLRETVNAAIRARQRGVPTFAITDSDKTPLARHCDSFWIAPVANPAFNGSYVGPVAAINALLVACAHIRPRRALALLKEKQQELTLSNRWFPFDEEDNKIGVNHENQQE